MTTALMEREPVTAPAVTAEQLALVKQTVAQGATDAELKLYLYDCARQGVHPLDRLLHFTKRGGKYTPVTSIDLMRTRAADTGEYAGSDDALFLDSEPGRPEWAQVTVYRLVQAQRCSFTATARWSEYYPGDGPGGQMWRKMPHTMLAKCAEALALRKGFPRQLAGLYAKEEMDQAGNGNGYTVEAPVSPELATRKGEDAPARSAGDSGQTKPLGGSNYASRQNPHTEPELPEGAVIIRKVESSPTKNKNVTKYFVTLSTGEQVTTIQQRLAGLCEQFCQDNTPVTVETKQTKWGTDLVTVRRAESEPEIPDADYLPPLDDDIPFSSGRM